MKKERVILFPGYEENGSRLKFNTDDDIVKTLSLGMELKVGRPSNRYYEFIHKSLYFNRHGLEDLQALLAIEGELVMVTSILTLRNLGSIAVLRRKDHKEFIKGTSQIYANVIQSLATNELLI